VDDVRSIYFYRSPARQTTNACLQQQQKGGKRERQLEKSHCDLCVVVRISVHFHTTTLVLNIASPISTMHNNIHSGGGRRQMLSSVDFYRHVPKDLTEVRVIFTPVQWLTVFVVPCCRFVEEKILTLE